MKTITIKDDGKLKTSEILQLMKSRFAVHCFYTNEQLDEQFPKPNKPAERSFLDSPEPDSETLGLSTREAEEKGFLNGITLRERMLLEIDYFDRTNNHLDVKGITFCSGSRDSDGSVPSVDWSSGDQEVDVDWYYVDNSHAKCGLRSAVTLNPFSLNPLEVADKQAIAHLKNNGYKIIKEF